LKKINIALDGFSSCGKSTLAKALANKLEYTYIDSGAMYRAVTLYFLRKGIIDGDDVQEDKIDEALSELWIDFFYNPETGKSETLLNEENVENEIREMEVSRNVSRVALIKKVRTRLIGIQQIQGQAKGVVMDGRDIGTNVFPDAELKIFMTADTDVRAQRRFEELTKKGASVTLEEIKANLADRDHQDTTRAENPLLQAEDAYVIDNTNLTQEQQFEMALGWSMEIINS
jgi:cytidylate kinase